MLSSLSKCLVAPYVGAWIETFDLFKDSFNISVAPYVGAWIETFSDGFTPAQPLGRTLRGCVD